MDLSECWQGDLCHKGKCISTVSVQSGVPLPVEMPRELEVHQKVKFSEFASKVLCDRSLLSFSKIVYGKDHGLMMSLFRPMTNNTFMTNFVSFLNNSKSVAVSVIEENSSVVFFIPTKLARDEQFPDLPEENSEADMLFGIFKLGPKYVPSETETVQCGPSQTPQQQDESNYVRQISDKVDDVSTPGAAAEKHDIVVPSRYFTEIRSNKSNADDETKDQVEDKKPKKLSLREYRIRKKLNKVKPSIVFNENPSSPPQSEHSVTSTPCVTFDENTTSPLASEHGINDENSNVTFVWGDADESKSQTSSSDACSNEKDTNHSSIDSEESKNDNEAKYIECQSKPNETDTLLENSWETNSIDRKNESESCDPQDKLNKTDTPLEVPSKSKTIDRKVDSGDCDLHGTQRKPDTLDNNPCDAKDTDDHSDDKVSDPQIAQSKPNTQHANAYEAEGIDNDGDCDMPNLQSERHEKYKQKGKNMTKIVCDAKQVGLEDSERCEFNVRQHTHSESEQCSCDISTATHIYQEFSIEQDATLIGFQISSFNSSLTQNYHMPNSNDSLSNATRDSLVDINNGSNKESTTPCFSAISCGSETTEKQWITIKNESSNCLTDDSVEDIVTNDLSDFVHNSLDSCETENTVTDIITIQPFADSRDFLTVCNIKNEPYLGNSVNTNTHSHTDLSLKTEKAKTRAASAHVRLLHAANSSGVTRTSNDCQGTSPVTHCQPETSHGSEQIHPSTVENSRSRSTEQLLPQSASLHTVAAETFTTSWDQSTSKESLENPEITFISLSDMSTMMNTHSSESTNRENVENTSIQSTKENSSNNTEPKGRSASSSKIVPPTSSHESLRQQEEEKIRRLHIAVSNSLDNTSTNIQGDAILSSCSVSTSNLVRDSATSPIIYLSEYAQPEYDASIDEEDSDTDSENEICFSLPSRRETIEFEPTDFYRILTNIDALRNCIVQLNTPTKEKAKCVELIDQVSEKLVEKKNHKVNVMKHIGTSTPRKALLVKVKTRKMETSETGLHSSTEPIQMSNEPVMYSKPPRDKYSAPRMSTSADQMVVTVRKLEQNAAKYCTSKILIQRKPKHTDVAYDVQKDKDDANIVEGTEKRLNSNKADAKDTENNTNKPSSAQGSVANDTSLTSINNTTINSGLIEPAVQVVKPLRNEGVKCSSSGETFRPMSSTSQRSTSRDERQEESHSSSTRLRKRNIHNQAEEHRRRGSGSWHRGGKVRRKMSDAVNIREWRKPNDSKPFYVILPSRKKRETRHHENKRRYCYSDDDVEPSKRQRHHKAKSTKDNTTDPNASAERTKHKVMSSSSEDSEHPQTHQGPKEKQKRESVNHQDNTDDPDSQRRQDMHKQISRSRSRSSSQTRIRSRADIYKEGKQAKQSNRSQVKTRSRSRSSSRDKINSKHNNASKQRKDTRLVKEDDNGHILNLATKQGNVYRPHVGSKWDSTDEYEYKTMSDDVVQVNLENNKNNNLCRLQQDYDDDDDTVFSPLGSPIRGNHNSWRRVKPDRCSNPFTDNHPVPNSVANLMFEQWSDSKYITHIGLVAKKMLFSSDMSVLPFVNKIYACKKTIEKRLANIVAIVTERNQQSKADSDSNDLSSGDFQSTVEENKQKFEMFLAIFEFLIRKVQTESALLRTTNSDQTNRNLFVLEAIEAMEEKQREVRQCNKDLLALLSYKYELSDETLIKAALRQIQEIDDDIGAEIKKIGVKSIS